MAEIREATEADWIRLQGGKPQVVSRLPAGKVVDVIHTSDGMVVPTTIDQIEKMGEAIFSIDGQPVSFPGYMVRKIHGDPCNQRSRTSGGQGYIKAKNS